jgi:hypothetical protein
VGRGGGTPFRGFSAGPRQETGPQDSRVRTRQRRSRRQRACPRVGDGPRSSRGPRALDDVVGQLQRLVVRWRTAVCAAREYAQPPRPSAEARPTGEGAVPPGRRIGQAADTGASGEHPNLDTRDTGDAATPADAVRAQTDSASRPPWSNFPGELPNAPPTPRRDHHRLDCVVAAHRPTGHGLDRPLDPPVAKCKSVAARCYNREYLAAMDLIVGVVVEAPNGPVFAAVKAARIWSNGLIPGFG